MNLSLDFTDATAAATSPGDLHPALWRASQVGRGDGTATATGFSDLDLHLPGGGWPHRALTELLLPHAGVGEMRLLAPALSALAPGCEAARGRGLQSTPKSTLKSTPKNTPQSTPQSTPQGTPMSTPMSTLHKGRTTGDRAVLLFDPPAGLCGQALATLGLDASRWVVIQGRDGLQGRARNLLPAADVLWALEQALKSGHVGAVLAWLPSRLRADSLRRLQLAAQSHDGPAFVLRDADARLRPSAAPLRLWLSAAGPDELSLRIVKRRGPPLAAPLRLMLAPVLPPVVRARAGQLRNVTGPWPAATPAPLLPPAAGVMQPVALPQAAG